MNAFRHQRDENAGALPSVSRAARPGFRDTDPGTREVWRALDETHIPAAVVATGELAEILERRPDLKGRSLAAVKQILRREARALRTSKTQK